MKRNDKTWVLILAAPSFASHLINELFVDRRICYFPAEMAQLVIIFTFLQKLIFILKAQKPINVLEFLLKAQIYAFLFRTTILCLKAEKLLVVNNVHIYIKTNIRAIIHFGKVSVRYFVFDWNFDCLFILHSDTVVWGNMCRRNEKDKNWQYSHRYFQRTQSVFSAS